MLGKRFRMLGVWMIDKKSTSTKPQIQDVEPRKGKFGSKTIPYVLGGDARIKKLRCVFCSVFWCLEERENIERG